MRSASAPIGVLDVSCLFIMTVQLTDQQTDMWGSYESYTSNKSPNFCYL